MKKLIFALNLVLLSGIVADAQKAKTDPNSNDRTTIPPQKNSNQTRSDNETVLQAGTALEAQLQHVLDVKKTQVGDQVILTTTKNVKRNGEITLAKGTRLIGRVIAVEQKTKQSEASKLSVVFERIEGKNLSSPIGATIVSITRADAGAALGDTLGTDVSASATSTGNVSRQNSGGGLLGGVSQTLGGVVGATAQVAGDATGANGQTLGGALGGIRISRDASAAVSDATTLSTGSGNLRLEKGVVFQLKLTGSVEK